MIRVVIVEDDPMVMDINSKFIQKVSGFKIVEKANSINKAKEFLENNEADLALLDVFLPDGKGIELLKWIRNNNIHIDIILITADKCKSSVDEAFKYGAIDYLIKPFKFQRLKETLESYKERFSNFKALEDLEQKNIDDYILKFNSNNEDKEQLELTKGLNISTYNKIIEAMKEKKDLKLKAEEIAKDSGLARVTVRRYLEKMAEEGKVEIIQEYGKIGRPTNYYKLM